MAIKKTVSGKSDTDSKRRMSKAVSGVRRVALQTETTGLGPGHRIIEIGCVELIGRKLTRRTFHRYVNPEREIDLGAMAVHGITDERVADESKFKDIAAEFIDFVRDAELVIHTAEFNVTYINNELGLLKLPPLEKITTGIACTLDMARKIRPGLKNSLDDLCAYYSVGKSGSQFYGTLLDAKLVAKIYLALTNSKVKK